MSDGNFNRSLLPSDKYVSGVRAGEARMKQKALLSFRSWLEQHFPDMTEEERRTSILQFKTVLDATSAK